MPKVAKNILIVCLRGTRSMDLSVVVNRSREAWKTAAACAKPSSASTRLSDSMLAAAEAAKKRAEQTKEIHPLVRDTSAKAKEVASRSATLQNSSASSTKSYDSPGSGKQADLMPGPRPSGSHMTSDGVSTKR